MFKDKLWIVLDDFNEIMEFEEYFGINVLTVILGIREF